jgi:hypothetical protein
MARKSDLQVVSGVVVKGLGCASHTTKIQFPIIGRLIPELSGLFPGTINVLADKALVLGVPDLRLPPVPDIHPNMCEFFDFWRIQLAEANDKAVPAFIYRSSGSIHRLNPCHLEIAAPLIEPRIKTGAKVFIRFQSPVRKVEWIAVG